MPANPVFRSAAALRVAWLAACLCACAAAAAQALGDRLPEPGAQAPEQAAEQVEQAPQFNLAGAPAQWTQALQRWLDAALARNRPPGAALRIDVSVGAPDPRWRAAPCAQVEPWLPAGARLWGRSRIGLRCATASQAGASAWNLLLPLTVRAFGPAWVLTSPVAAGATLKPEDALPEQSDWAADPAPILAHAQQWQGQVATRALQAGQALRQGMVRAPTLFAAGAAVKLLAQGPGYSVSAAGQALSAGAAGQTVRVLLDNGRIVSGVVNPSGAVDVW